MKSNRGKAKERLTTAHYALVAIATILVLIYIISPIDIIPDVIPIIGWIDDIIVLALYLGLVLGMWK